MALGRLWAGRAYGTNTGNLFVRLSGDDEHLQGHLHLNDTSAGLVVYSIHGKFDGIKLTLGGTPESAIEGVTVGDLVAWAELNAKGELHGEWATKIGTAGTFVLYPHDQRDVLDSNPEKRADQFHVARHPFNAVALDRSEILALADKMQSDFARSEVVITVTSGTEQSRYLVDFKKTSFASKRADGIKLFVQQPEIDGINRVAMIEFGPHLNLAMTQGADEAWVLGMLEKLKQSVRPLERTYATNIKRLGFGINQILVFGAVIFLPTLATIWSRSVLLLGVFLINLAVNWLHERFLPFAEIYLVDRPKSALVANTISWMIAASSALVAALLAAYLQGWLKL